MSGWIRDAIFFSIVVTISAGTGALAERTIWKTEADARQSRFETDQKDLNKRLNDIDISLININLSLEEHEMADDTSIRQNGRYTRLSTGPRTFHAEDFHPATTTDLVNFIATQTANLRTAVEKKNQELQAANQAGKSVTGEYLNVLSANEKLAAATSNALDAAQGIDQTSRNLERIDEDRIRTLESEKRSLQDQVQQAFNRGFNQGGAAGFAAAQAGGCR